MDYQNPFMGINPLLHEILLSRRGWTGFYKVFLVECFKWLQKPLYGTPYIADLEGNGFTHGPNDYKPLISLVIHKIEERQPVTWIEFVIPLYKLPNELYHPYCEQRQRWLDKGINFIEIDFVHTQPPTFQYDDYSTFSEGAYPFHITIMQNPTSQVFHFGVLEPIPTIAIPLLNSDEITIDLDAIYQKLFADFFYAAEIARSHPQLTTYHPDDRAKILAHIQKSEDSPSI
jgi:hypothetical protein